jgi:hypothetical protein
MKKEIIKEEQDNEYGCSKCVYSKPDSIVCHREGGCGTENKREYYLLVDDNDELKSKQI